MRTADPSVLREMIVGFPPVKSGDQVTITAPPPCVLVPERNMKKKILQVINKVTEMLMGEIPIGCQDVPTFSSKEWQNVEGHKDLSKNIMMENQPPLTSPDGCINRNPPEICTGPFYSQYCPQEDPIITHHYQSVEFKDLKTDTKDSHVKYVRSDQQTTEEGNMMRTIKEEEETYVRSGCLSTEEGEMLRITNEGTYVRSDHQPTEDYNRIQTIKENKCPLNISTDVIRHQLTCNQPEESSRPWVPH